jgi:hypothetical protein
VRFDSHLAWAQACSNCSKLSEWSVHFFKVLVSVSVLLSALSSQGRSAVSQDYIAMPLLTNTLGCALLMCTTHVPAADLHHTRTRCTSATCCTHVPATDLHHARTRCTSATVADVSHVYHAPAAHTYPLLHRRMRAPQQGLTVLLVVCRQIPASGGTGAGVPDVLVRERQRRSVLQRLW